MRERSAVAAAAALVVLAGMAAANGSLLSTHPTPWRPALLTGPSPHPSRPAPRDGRTSLATAAPGSGTHAAAPPTWLEPAAVVLGLLLLAALLAYVAARVLRSSVWRTVTAAPTVTEPVRPEVRPDPAAVQRVATQVDAAFAALDEEHDPRAAVIACWLRVEEAAGRAGVKRAASETSAELAGRVMASFRVDTRPLAELNLLYRTARYSPHPVSESERDAARSALLAVRDGLRAAPAGTTP